MKNFKEYIVKFTNRCVYLGVFIREIMVFIWNIPDIQMTKVCAILFIPITFFDLFETVKKNDNIKAGLNEIFWHLLILFYWVKFLVETNMNRSYLAKIWLVFIAAVMLGYIAVKRRKKKASDRMK